MSPNHAHTHGVVTTLFPLSGFTFVFLYFAFFFFLCAQCFYDFDVASFAYTPKLRQTLIFYHFDCNININCMDNDANTVDGKGLLNARRETRGGKRWREKRFPSLNALLIWNKNTFCENWAHHNLQINDAFWDGRRVSGCRFPSRI